MIIQKILTPYKSTSLIEPLYFLKSDGRLEYSDDSYSLQAGSKVSFNSYINSFYEAYWCEKTNIDHVRFEFQLTGSGLIEFYRDTINNGCFSIKIESVQSESENVSTKVSIDIDLNRKNLLVAAGRIFFDIEAITDLYISSIDIVTDSPVQRHVDMTIGICTFNREHYLAHNIQDLINLKDKDTLFKKIIIVNQGNRFSDKDLLACLENPIIHCVEQANLGGTGGFTRSMIEAMRFDSTYHLLMDDDILLDVRLLQRVVAFASYAKHSVAIGGQMLDSLRPTMMHEYGALIKSDGYIKPLLQNFDLADFSNLYNFNKVVSIDYNAWWFCAIPMEAIKELDLPAPIFIRGDDEEFGLRLKRSGRETVGLPGVGVWHEPFYIKSGGWQTYYDFRNRFILATVYEGMKPQSIRSLSWAVYSALLNHDYQFAALVIEAINDFAKGDKLLEQTSDKVHERVLSIAKKYAPKDASHIDFKPPKEENILKPWSTLRSRGVNVLRQTVKNATPYHPKKKKHLYDRHVHPVNIDGKAYIKTNGIQSYKFLYENEPKVFRDLFVKYIWAMRSYNIALNDTALWSDISKYRSLEQWDKIFN